MSYTRSLEPQNKVIIDQQRAAANEFLIHRHIINVTVGRMYRNVFRTFIESGDDRFLLRIEYNTIGYTSHPPLCPRFYGIRLFACIQVRRFYESRGETEEKWIKDASSRGILETRTRVETNARSPPFPRDT